VNKITLDNPNDNAIGNNGSLYGTTPDGVIGMMIYSAKFYTGISINQVFGAKATLKNNLTGIEGRADLQAHYFLTAGYRVQLNSEFALIPSTLVRYYPGTNLSVDLTAKVNYLDLIWLGASYRADDAMVFLIGATYGRHLDFGYSYDMSANHRNNYIRINSHEIMVGYRIVNKQQSGRPSYIW
jgi:type IX secretion system PorP/SprF family membrane protein